MRPRVRSHPWCPLARLVAGLPEVAGWRDAAQEAESEQPAKHGPGLSDRLNRSGCYQRSYSATASARRWRGGGAGLEEMFHPGRPFSSREDVQSQWSLSQLFVISPGEARGRCLPRFLYHRHLIFASLSFICSISRYHCLHILFPFPLTLSLKKGLLLNLFLFSKYAA